MHATINNEVAVEVVEVISTAAVESCAHCFCVNSHRSFK